MSAETPRRNVLRPGGHVTDWGRMRSAQVRFIATPTTEQELAEVMRDAARRKLKVSLRGVGHSAGGQSFTPDGIMIDLRELNRLLELDPGRKTVRVQSGATWKVLTDVLEPHRLAITTKQEFEIFTVGGSVAANVHGKSVDYGPLIESIESFRLMKAGGEIVAVSRDENAELFPLVIGGYGLFGVLVDVTFRLVDDRPVEKSEVVLMNRDPLLASYCDRIRRAPQDTPLCYGFLDATCTRGFYVTYSYADEYRSRSLAEMKRDEPNPTLFNLLIRLQRWSKSIRRRGFKIMWAGSAKPEITLRSRRLQLWDEAPRAFQDMLLQKYFVPIDRFGEFARRVGNIFAEYVDDLPLMTNHFRYVPGNDEAVMSFAPRDSICMIPCYLANKDSSRWLRKLEEATAKLLDAALDLGGSYYLTFDTIASPEQFQRAYPRWRQFFECKRRIDPDEMFSSLFYEKYARDQGG